MPAREFNIVGMTSCGCRFVTTACAEYHIENGCEAYKKAEDGLVKEGLEKLIKDVNELGRKHCEKKRKEKLTK